MEDDGRWGLRKDRRWGWADAVVDEENEEGDEDEVDGGEDGGSGWKLGDWWESGL